MKVNNFIAELRVFAEDNDKANKAVTAYNRGLITFSEALKLVRDAYNDEVISEYKEDR